MKQLKSADYEKDLLERELDRMQKIDRFKVQHAKTVLYN